MTKKKITIVKLNNKSRKGLYTRITENGKTRYYKIKEDTAEIPEKTQKKKTIQTTNLEKQITPGIHSITTTTKLNTKQIHQNMKTLLNKQVKNKKLLNEIAKEHNIQKIAKRLEHVVTIIGTKGETLATITKTGITQQKATKEINKELEQGQELDSSPGMRDLNGQGWHGTLTQPGTIQKILIKTIIRKRR